MPDEVYVDVQYRGLELGSRLRMEDFVDSEAYMHHPTPMPVGSALVIDSGEGVDIAVRVQRVFEQVAGAERPPGMLVCPHELAGAAQGWWDAKVAASGPRESTAEGVAEPAPQAAEAPGADEGKKKSRKRKKRASQNPEQARDTKVMDVALPVDAGAETQVMHAVSPEEGADTIVMDAVNPEEIAAAAASEEASGNTAKGKKRRSRRKKR